MKKMKRIVAVVKGKAGMITAVLSRKASRITRNVDQAIAWAEDQIEIAKECAESIIDSFGEVADGTHTEECSERIKYYIEKVKEIKEWEDTLAILKGLKVKLDEEVEVKENDNEE